MSDVLAAETADKEFSEGLRAYEAKEKAKAAKHAARLREYEELRPHRNRMAAWAKWGTAIPERMRELTQLQWAMQYLHWCVRNMPKLDNAQPQPSTYYYPELAPSGGVCGGSDEPEPFKRDTSKLFHLFSEGTRKDCRYQVSWHREDGPRAVAILVHVGICFHESMLFEREGRLIDQSRTYHIADPGDVEWFTIRIDHHLAYKLMDYGDCCRLLLYD
jgi:hypothetical protein